MSSAELITHHAKGFDLAALNAAAGLVTGPVERDPYGPYLPVRMPAKHRLLTAPPQGIDPAAYKSHPEAEWRHRLARVAPAFVRYMVDPIPWWLHNREVERRWYQDYLIALGGADWDIDPVSYRTDPMWGGDSFINSDGKIAARIGDQPRQRTTPTPRIGVHTLSWDVISVEHKPWLQLAATLVMPMTAGRYLYRDMLLIVLEDGGLKHQWRNSDMLATPVADPMTALPQLPLGHRPHGWVDHTVAGLTFALPPTFRPSRDREWSAAADYRDGSRHTMVLTVGPGALVDPLQPSWAANQKLSNARLMLPSGQPVLAQWGPSLGGNEYWCQAVIQHPHRTWTLEFSTTATTAVADLRRHAATWSVRA